MRISGLDHADLNAIVGSTDDQAVATTGTVNDGVIEALGQWGGGQWGGGQWGWLTDASSLAGELATMDACAVGVSEYQNHLKSQCFIGPTESFGDCRQLNSPPDWGENPVYQSFWRWRRFLPTVLANGSNRHGWFWVRMKCRHCQLEA